MMANQLGNRHAGPLPKPPTNPNAIVASAAVSHVDHGGGYRQNKALDLVAENDLAFPEFQMGPQPNHPAFRVQHGTAVIKARLLVFGVGIQAEHPLYGLRLFLPGAARLLSIGKNIVHMAAYIQKGGDPGIPRRIMNLFQIITRFPTYSSSCRSGKIFL